MADPSEELTDLHGSGFSDVLTTLPKAHVVHDAPEELGVISDTLA